ncbi:MAG TPA: GNAT family protein [Bacteroidales bacterium]|nr:GNAT family protein [Bacteroidales bacterium]HSA43342.1 GNAT family protein [Bacteroidales bacterium]
MKGENIYLRAMEPADVDLLYEWENDPALWHLSNIVAPVSKFTLEQYVFNARNDIHADKQLRLIIMHKGETVTPIGTIDLFDYDPLHRRAGVGILLVKSHRQRGYGREALSLLISYAFEMLQLHQLYCNILEDNKVSMKLFLNAGFIICGTKKQWHRTAGRWKDEHMLQLINPVTPV